MSCRVCKGPIVGRKSTAVYCSVRCQYTYNKAKLVDYYQQYSRAYHKSKYGKYVDQKNTAKQRGVEWRLTYEEWRSWWGKDFAKRGKGVGKLVMARHDDCGPYAIGNIYKATFSANCIDRERWKRAAKRAA